MIPADVASRLKLAVPDQPTAPQPATPARNLADVLSDLVPGQRVLAEIQSMLPNGAYRAMVAQREITLALPFSAKPGDSLELEVVDNDGQMALAFVANRSAGGAASPAQDSVATTLSRTGRLIGDLLGGIDDQGKKAAPAPLNGNQPLVDKFPASGADLAPILKDALSKSGVFYEAHQARWVAGQLPTEQLLKEPQGQFSQLRPGAAEQPGALAGSANVAAQREAAAVGTQTNEAVSASARTAPGTIPAELTPLVQQQLDALATQTFAWQGQIWPGQQMSWEIEEQQDNKRGDIDENAGRWQTRLMLTLPHLGGIEAQLRLRAGNEIEISLSADSAGGTATLDAGGDQLRRQFEAAGLTLTQLQVKRGEAAE